jgi:hypothetical protein
MLAGARSHKSEPIAFDGKRPVAAGAGPDADRFLQASSEAAALPFAEN